MLGPRSRSEIDFLEKKSENVINTGTPPRLATCVIWKNAEFGDFEHVAIQKLKDLTKGCPGPFWAWKLLFLTIFFILSRQNLEKINFGEFRKNPFLVILQQFCLCETAHFGRFWCKKCKKSKVTLEMILLTIMLGKATYADFRHYMLLSGAPRYFWVPNIT